MCSLYFYFNSLPSSLPASACVYFRLTARDIVPLTLTLTLNLTGPWFSRRPSQSSYRPATL